MSKCQIVENLMPRLIISFLQHLMNEWLIEKNETKPKTEPLEVAVDEENMFVTCLPSPRNSMDRLRRNSQSGGGRPLVQSSAGSAKKVGCF